MILYAARKIGTDLYINKQSLGLVPLSGAAKLNAQTVLRNKIISIVKYRGRELQVSVDSFELVEFEMIERNTIPY